MCVCVCVPCCLISRFCSCCCFGAPLSNTKGFHAFSANTFAFRVPSCLFPSLTERGTSVEPSTRLLTKRQVGHVRPSRPLARWTARCVCVRCDVHVRVRMCMYVSVCVRSYVRCVDCMCGRMCVYNTDVITNVVKSIIHSPVGKCV